MNTRNRKRLVGLGLPLVAISIVALAHAQTVQSVIGNVFLQNTTPGTVQAGHASIGGTFRAGQVFAQQGTATTTPVVGNNTAVGAGFAYGGSFSSAQKSGTGARGTATTTVGPGTGLYGEARSVDGRGVVGNCDPGLGVYGLGLYGVYGNGSLTGVVGETANANGAGVEGVSIGSGPALLARNTTGGLAARILGTVDVQGAATVKGIFTIRDASGQDILQSRDFGGNSQVKLTKSGSQASSRWEVGSGSSSLVLLSKLLSQVSLNADSNGVGSVTADVKNFVQPDPDNEARDIVYASIEGPEAAAYVRGTAKLVNGSAHVPLPRHFQNVATAEGMTVQLTATSADSEGLAVVSQSLTALEVREMRHGHGTYLFHWEVKAVRRGFTDYKVYRPWDEMAPADSDRATAMQARRENARKVYGIEYSRSRP